MPSTYNFCAHLLNTLVPDFQLIVSKDNYVISQTIKTCKSCECMQRMQHNSVFSKDVPIKQCFIIFIFFSEMTIIFRMQYKSCNNYNINVIFEHNNWIKEVKRNIICFIFIFFYSWLMLDMKFTKKKPRRYHFLQKKDRGKQHVLW